MRRVVTMMALGALAATAGATVAADSFRRLKGREITARFSGMEFTDDVHWAQVFARGGRLSTFAMGKASGGIWGVQNDELCWENGRGPRCHEVWISGTKVQLRTPGIDIYDEGVLRKPKERR